MKPFMLRMLREQLDLSSIECAQLISNTTGRTWQNYESGAYPIPNYVKDDILRLTRLKNTAVLDMVEIISYQYSTPNVVQSYESLQRAIRIKEITNKGLIALDLSYYKCSKDYFKNHTKGQDDKILIWRIHRAVVSAVISHHAAIFTNL